MGPTTLVLLTLSLATTQPRTEVVHGAPLRRMSFHNRLLFNRAVISRLKSIQVLVLAASDPAASRSGRDTEEIGNLVRRLGGRVLRNEREIGYLRIEVPTEQLLDLIASPVVTAYQVSSLSRGSWYRDGPPLSNATMFRGFEATPIAGNEPSAGGVEANLPSLTIDASREPGYTADDDVGLKEWFAEHPTFDGRGVTIALVETAAPPFTDPTLQSAKTLDGRDVPKIAGILNTIGPDRPDDTRVVLDTEVRAQTTWARVGGRTYILPRPGAYRFGLLVLPAGGHLVHQFAVLEDLDSADVWIDADGDASFEDEAPLADLNERFEPRVLKVAAPRKADVSFVMSRGRQTHVVHFYLGRGSHAAMTLSVAAGSRTNEGLAYGVAPNARVLLVRSHGSDYQLDVLLEGFIEAARRPDVDVISASAGVTMVPDTAADFVGLLFRRLVIVYGKPVVNSAGNSQLWLGTSHALGGALTVGGSLGPGSFASLYGGRPFDSLLVHHMGAAGPSIDGAIKPDFVAPMERLAADLPWNRNLEAVPKNMPHLRLPPGYQIACCTSSSSPYAAGVLALLISAARQMKLPYTVESLLRAVKVSARFLPAFQSHEQGNGVLDVNAAWRELARPADVPRTVAEAAVVHPLAQYAARGPNGQGVLEFEGWTAGAAGTRGLRLRRESGPETPVTYLITWTGNDGTFRTAAAVTLPLGKTVTVPLRIGPRAAGAHSAILNLRDASSGAIVFRTQATIVAAEPIDGDTRLVRVAGRVAPMRAAQHYIRVPPGARAITIEVEMLRGVVQPAILLAHGLFPSYYHHLHPTQVHVVGTGRHVVTLSNPAPGTWAVHLANTSMWFRLPDDPTPRDAGTAEYVLTVRMHAASLVGSAPDGGKSNHD